MSRSPLPGASLPRFWWRIERGAARDAQLVKRDRAWRRLTWSEVGDVVRELAFGLLALGRRPGDTVAILAASRAEWVLADFAILSSGCTTVPLYPTYTPWQIEDILNECETRTVIVEDRVQLSRVLEVRDKLSALEQVVDRKKDLIVTSGGINIAPQQVEQLLRRDALVADAMLYGDRRPYPTALIALDPAAVARFARKHGLLVSDYAQLTQHPDVMARVKAAVEAANAQLQSYAQIKKFAVIPGELTEAGGELTPTQKMKRRVVAAKYQALLEALHR